MVALLVSSLAILGPNTWELNAFITKMGYKKERESSVVSGVRLDYVRMTYERSTTGGGQAGTGTKSVGPKPIPTVRNEIQVLATSSKLTASPTWATLKHIHHLESAYIGSREGAHFYLMAPIPESLAIQKQLQLQGGMDWQWLAAKGTSIEDEGRYTANGCAYLFREGDDTGLRNLVSFVTPDGNKSWYTIMGIARVPTKAATDQLITLYRSNSEELRQAVAYALVSEPLRKEAKAAYIDMIARSTYVEEASKAAIQWKWDDAVPALLTAIDKPRNVSSLIAALEAERTLTGKPVPEEVIAAGKSAFSASPREVSATKSVLLAHPDKELIAAYAYRYANAKSKVDTSAVTKMGREVLELLPASDRELVLSKFKD